MDSETNQDNALVTWGLDKTNVEAEPINYQLNNQLKYLKPCYLIPFEYMIKKKNMQKQQKTNTTALCLNWVVCMTGRSFLYAQRESGTVTSSPSCRKRRFNNLPFTLFFHSDTIETPLCGSIQRSNLPCCCERAALQSQLWLSLQVLKWGLQKVNKLLFPPSTICPLLLTGLL